MPLAFQAMRECAAGRSRRVRFSPTTVFLDAVATGDIEQVTLCLKAGVPAAFANEAQTTAAHLAAAAGHVEVLALLLEAGADPNGKFALMSAAGHLTRRAHRAALT